MAYNGVNDGNGWEDTPSKKTPRNAKNFNIMELGIKLAHTLIAALQAQIDQLVIHGDSSPAVAQALVNAVGKVFATLKARLDDIDERLDKKATYYDLDTQTGTALHFANAEDAVINIVKIEGSTLGGGAGTTTDNPATLSDATTFDVLSCRKNKCPQLPATITTNGITYTKNSDGSITMNGTCSYETNTTLGTLIGDGVTPYTLSGNVGGSGSTVLLRLFRIQNNAEFIDSGSGVTTIPNATQHLIWLTVKNGVTLNNVTFYPQLEVGSTKTPYEAYKGDKVTIPSNYQMAGLPNGVRDTLLPIDGGVLKHLRKIGTKVLQASDIVELGLGTYIDYIRVNLTSFPGIVAQVAGTLTNCMLTSMCSGETSILGWDAAINNYKWAVNNVSFYILVPHGKYSNLAAAQSAITGKVVKYQLATPIETITSISSYLTSYQCVTNVFTTSNPQVTITASAKSQLWNDRRSIDDLKANKFDIAKIVNSDTIGGMDKIASAEVTKAHGQSLATLSNGLTDITNRNPSTNLSTLFANGETLLGFANLCTTHTTKFKAQNVTNINDIPPDMATNGEFLAEVYLCGDGMRKIIFLHPYGAHAIYKRDIYNGAYLFGWQKISYTAL